MANLDDVERWKPLYTYIGQLVVRYAGFESYLSMALRFNMAWRIDLARYSNPRDYASAVFGSQRFKTMRDTIKRIITHECVLTAAQKDALLKTFEQVAHVATLRDKLAHQNILPHPDDPLAWLISDTFTTRIESERKSWVITNSSIGRATADLFVAEAWLGNHAQSGTLFKGVSEQPPAWRYKSSELKLLRPDIANDLRTRAVQHRP